ncbi:MAG TPA: DUF932 domain-containing protein [Gemmataceae bacterium]|nr:DUF932 domain-containing protein [Gemmataceae bacterium]
MFGLPGPLPVEQPEQLGLAVGGRQLHPQVDSGAARLTTAGSLCEGRRVWVMAEIGDFLTIVKGDEVRRFVLLSNSHDGTQSVRVGLPPIRVVCANTLAMAHGDAESQLLWMLHTSGLKDGMEKVRETMTLANAEFEATAEQYKRLAASKVVNRADLREYVKRVMLLTDDPKKAGELTKKSADVYAAILENFDSGKGTENKKVRGDVVGGLQRGDRVPQLHPGEDGGRAARRPLVRGGVQDQRGRPGRGPETSGLTDSPRRTAVTAVRFGPAGFTRGGDLNTEWASRPPSRSPACPRPTSTSPPSCPMA